MFNWGLPVPIFQKYFGNMEAANMLFISLERYYYNTSACFYCIKIYAET